jgi:central glycolytic genes regulator
LQNWDPLCYYWDISCPYGGKMIFMDRIIHLHKKIAPKLIEVVESRYNILRHIFYVQPVGRRTLAGQLMIGERVVRAEVDFLKTQGLLDITAGGMIVTSEGEALITDLAEYIHKLRGLYGLEQQLTERLGLRQAAIIPGDCDGDETVKKELGQAAARFLDRHIIDGSTIAVTGGTTMAEVANALHSAKRDVLVLPARGGLGEEVEYQANTIAASMAKKMGGNYRLLYLPDLLSRETIDTIASQDPGIREILSQIRKTDVLLLSIGRMDAMARRRGFGEQQITELMDAGAIGEALGYYFNLQGELVYMTHSVGMRMEDLPRIATVVAIAGGRSKAPAILSVLRNYQQQVLVTDEAAAREMLALLK